MAGAGYKLFATGDVLTAAQVNTYLMQQTVMVFASSAARTSALSGVLAEGMVSYLQDTNTLEVYDGAAWVGATGDITALTAGTGISISSATGPVPTVTNSMATEITAKGDLIVGTGSATFDNLAAGSNGETLVADSSTSTGLRYTAGTVQENPVLNSAFQIAQRGTSVAVNAALAYSLDRWQSYYAGNLTISRQATGDTTNLPFIQYCARFQRNAGQTNTTGTNFNQNLETVNSIPFAGKTVTFSFYARKGANYSPTSDSLTYALISGTGTDQNYLSSWTGSSNVVFAAATLTSTWQRFTATGTVSASATQLTINFSNTPTGTAGANDYYEVTGVQIDIGSVALPFRTYAGTIQGELAACQRYLPAITTVSNADVGTGYNVSTTQPFVMVPFQVPARVAPTGITVTAANVGVRNTGGSVITCTAVAFNNASPMSCSLLATVASGLVAGQGTTMVLATSTILFTGCEL
jgi:hypothetical protein